MDSVNKENEGFVYPSDTAFVQPQGLKETAKVAGHAKSLSLTGLIFAVAGLASGSSKAASVKLESRTHQIPAPISVPRSEKSVLELIKSDMKQHRREVNAALMVLFALSVFFFYNYLKAGLALLALTAMGALSRAWQRFFPIEFGIELVMLATVISGVAYGAIAGAVVGVVSLVLSTILTQEDPGKMWPAFATIVLSAYFPERFRLQISQYGGSCSQRLMTQ